MEKELVAIIFSSSRMQLGIKETGQMKMSTFGRRSAYIFLCLFYFILEIYIVTAYIILLAIFFSYIFLANCNLEKKTSLNMEPNNI